MATTRVEQDGLVVRVGDYENPPEVFFDVSAQTLVIQTLNASKARIDAIRSTATVLSLLAADGVVVTLAASVLTIPSGTTIDFDAAAGAYATFLRDVNNLEILDTQGVASAVNQWGMTNAATGAGPALVARGGDTNIDSLYTAKGTGAHVFDNGTDPIMLKLMGAAGGYNNEITDVNGLEILALQGVASAVNEFGITNAATGGGPSLITQGGDTNIDALYTAKGTGAHVFNNGTDPVMIKLMGAAGGYNNEITDLNGLEILALQGVASAVNELGIKNAITAASPTLIAQGGDANISVTVEPKGSGNLVVGGKVLDNGSIVSEATAGDVTYTGANFVSNIERNPGTGARTDTTPTAADIVAAFINPKANSSLDHVIVNMGASAVAVTLGAGSGVTLRPGTVTIAQNKAAHIKTVLTNVTGGSEAVTCFVTVS